MASPRRLLEIAILAAAAYLGLSYLLFPTSVARVRIGLDLTVGGVTRSASNVVELRSRAGFGLAGLDGPGRPVLRGEAVTLKLGGSTMLVLLLNPADPTTPSDWALRQIIVATGGDRHGPIETAIAALGGQSGRFVFASTTAEVGGSARALHPDLVLISDLRLFDGRSRSTPAWRHVPLLAPDDALGTEGAEITIWVEPVSRLRPISRGDLALRLPSFELFFLRHLLSNPPADVLRPASLKVD